MSASEQISYKTQEPSFHTLRSGSAIFWKRRTPPYSVPIHGTKHRPWHGDDAQETIKINWKIRFFSLYAETLPENTKYQLIPNRDIEESVCHLFCPQLYAERCEEIVQMFKGKYFIVIYFFYQLAALNGHSYTIEDRISLEVVPLGQMANHSQIPSQL